MLTQHTSPPTVTPNKAILAHNAHFAPLAVLEQDGSMHLLHSVIEALQGHFHHSGHQDVGVQAFHGDGDGTETEHH